MFQYLQVIFDILRRNCIQTLICLPYMWSAPANSQSTESVEYCYEVTSGTCESRTSYIRVLENTIFLHEIHITQPEIERNEEAK